MIIPEKVDVNYKDAKRNTLTDNFEMERNLDSKGGTL